MLHTGAPVRSANLPATHTVRAEGEKIGYARLTTYGLRAMNSPGSFRMHKLEFFDMQELLGEKLDGGLYFSGACPRNSSSSSSWSSARTASCSTTTPFSSSSCSTTATFLSPSTSTSANTTTTDSKPSNRTPGRLRKQEENFVDQLPKFIVEEVDRREEIKDDLAKYQRRPNSTAAGWAQFQFPVLPWRSTPTNAWLRKRLRREEEVNWGVQLKKALDEQVDDSVWFFGVGGWLCVEMLPECGTPAGTTPRVGGVREHPEKMSAKVFAYNSNTGRLSYAGSILLEGAEQVEKHCSASPVAHRLAAVESGEGVIPAPSTWAEDAGATASSAATVSTTGTGSCDGGNVWPVYDAHFPGGSGAVFASLWGGGSAVLGPQRVGSFEGQARRSAAPCATLQIAPGLQFLRIRSNLQTVGGFNANSGKTIFPGKNSTGPGAGATTVNPNSSSRGNFFSQEKQMVPTHHEHRERYSGFIPLHGADGVPQDFARFAFLQEFLPALNNTGVFSRTPLSCLLNAWKISTDEESERLRGFLEVQRRHVQTSQQQVQVFAGGDGIAFVLFGGRTTSPPSSTNAIPSLVLLRLLQLFASPHVLAVELVTTLSLVPRRPTPTTTKILVLAGAAADATTRSRIGTRGEEQVKVGEEQVEVDGHSCLYRRPIFKRRQRIDWSRKRGARGPEPQPGVSADEVVLEHEPQKAEAKSLKTVNKTAPATRRDTSRQKQSAASNETESEEEEIENQTAPTRKLTKRQQALQEKKRQQQEAEENQRRERAAAATRKRQVK